MAHNLPASALALRMGDRVRAQRVEAKLSLADLANTIGKSEAEMKAIETGQDTLKAREIVALCKVLGVAPSWFFDELL